MSKQFQALARLDIDQARERLELKQSHARRFLACINRIGPLAENAAILDIGAAQGQFAIACAKLGLKASGVEPAEKAVALAGELAAQNGVDVSIKQGFAEQLPFDDEQFDIVHSNSVMEHVCDAQKSMDEAFRVLRPGGIFWFSTASALCPRQMEIRRFPCFGWYPDRLKRKIMFWARDNAPHLVGHSVAPAINWFTPAKAQRMLSQAGFDRFFDRWDLARADGSPLRRLVLSSVKSSRATRVLSQVLIRNFTFAGGK